MISAILRLKRLEGTDRPAIATVFPTTTGYCLIVDAGANSECRPHHMLSFALMGGCLCHTGNGQGKSPARPSQYRGGIY